MGSVLSSTTLPKEPPAIPRVSSTALPKDLPAIPLGGEEDLISALPDELLHIILSRLPSAAAAARTSVLSRRWRGVWAHMPELVLGGIPAPPAPATTSSALLDSMDAALNPYAAPTLRSLNIDVIGLDRCDVPANRISPWLRFASERLAGNLRLRLVPNIDLPKVRDMKQELALPICERATEIDIDLSQLRGFFLRPPPTGSFSALTDLNIASTQMDGGELGRLVSSVQCPCLRKLWVFVVELQPVRNISISSESLECFFWFSARETGKLEVNAPMLKDIGVSYTAEACIAAPKLENFEWAVPYDPLRHQFAVAGRHIRSLSIKLSTCHSSLVSSTRLMERFDTVSELTVSLSLGKEVVGYMTFLKEIDKLPICETLVVRLTMSHSGHDFAPMMLHLLRRSICIRKFKIILHQRTPSEVPSCTTLDCPCLLPENYRLDDITFDSLEEIGISFFTGSAEQEEFLELLLSRCNTMTLKRVDFTTPFSPVSSEITEAVQRIRRMCHPNSKVQVNVNCLEVLKP